METIVILQNGYTQLILTPENEFEKHWVRDIETLKYSFKKYVGHYHCQGGWIREGEGEDSLMFVFEKEG